jgi:cyclic pyranopterin phosphate synthase
MVNVNHPTSYSDSRWNLLKTNLAILANAKDAESLLTLSLNIDRPEQDFEYLFDLAQLFKIKKFRVDISRPEPDKRNTFIEMEQIPEVIPTLLALIKKCKNIGIEINTDCCLPLCCISNQQLQDFAENGIEVSFKCSGGIDVTPDLELWYCAPLRFVTLGKITDYANAKEIVTEMERKTHELRWNVELKQECKECKFWTLKICHGGCLAFKNTKVH